MRRSATLGIGRGSYGPVLLVCRVRSDAFAHSRVKNPVRLMCVREVHCTGHSQRILAVECATLR